MSILARGHLVPGRFVGALVLGLTLGLAGGCEQIADMDLPNLDDITGHQVQLDELPDTNWRATEIAGFGHAGAAESIVSFNQDDQVSGKTGCNTYLGPYRLNGNQITFGPFAMTRMMCEPEVAPQEDAFLAALAKATTIELSRNVMTLRDASGTSLMTLVLVE